MPRKLRRQQGGQKTVHCSTVEPTMLTFGSDPAPDFAMVGAALLS